MGQMQKDLMQEELVRVAEDWVGVGMSRPAQFEG